MSASVADFFKEPAQWTVYPKTDPLSFDLTMMKPLKSDAVDQPGRLDHFRVVGLIESASDGAVAARIQRNPHPVINQVGEVHHIQLNQPTPKRV